MCNLENSTNQLIYKAETDSQTEETNLQLPKGKREREAKIRSMGLIDMHHYRSLGEGNGYPLQYSSLENFRDRGTWWASL